MKKIIKRLIAFVLACVMCTGTIVIDNSIVTVKAASAQEETIVTPEPTTTPEVTITPEPTTTPEEVSSYKIKISEVPVYSGETTKLSAVVYKDGNAIESVADEITWSCDITNAVINQSGELTVNAGVAEGTVIRVTAIYKNEELLNVTEQVDLRVAARATTVVSGTVVDAYGNIPLENVEIIFTQSAISDNSTVTAKTDNNGVYSVTLYNDVTYSMKIEDPKYLNVSRDDFTTTSDANITLNQNLDFNIVGNKEAVTVGDVLELNAVFTNIAWNGTAVNWTSSNEDILSIKDGIITANTKGTAVVTAECRGISHTTEIVVNGDSNVELKLEVKSDNKEISNKNKVYPKVEGKDYNSKVVINPKVVKTKDNKEITDGNIEIILQKKTDDTWVNIGEPITNIAPSVEKEFEFTTSGTYRFKVKYNGATSATASSEKELTAHYEFVVSSIDGQNIEFDESVESFVYGEDESGSAVKGIRFTALVSEKGKEEIAEGDTTVALKYALKATAGDDRITIREAVLDKIEEEADENGFYKVEGYVSFVINRVDQSNTKLTISVEYSHVTDENTKVYTNAKDDIVVDILPKPVTINKIEYGAGKVYDGTPTVSGEDYNIVLKGVEDGDVVIAELNAPSYSSAHAGNDLWLVSDKMLLSGDDSQNYTYDESYFVGALSTFTGGVISERVISIDSVLDLSKVYYTENPSNEEIAAKVTYGNFVEGEEDLKQYLEGWHPMFTVSSSLESEMYDDNGELVKYAVIASNPSAEDKPSELIDYTFDLNNDGSGTQIGILTITMGEVDTKDYIVVDADGVKKINQNNIYLRTNLKNDKLKVGEKLWFIEFPVMNSGNEGEAPQYKYNEAVCVGYNVKEIKFKLRKVTDDGKVVAESNIKTISCTPDGFTKVTIQIDRTDENSKSYTSIIQKLTLGIFGNQKNTSAKILYDEGNGSGIKKQYYDVIAYTELLDTENSYSEEKVKEYLQDYANWTEVAPVDNIKNTVAVNFEDGEQILIAKIIDNVGNEKYVTSTGIVIDSVEPEVFNVKIVKAEDDNVYGRNVELQIEANDFDDAENNKNAYSGIKKITYTATLNENTEYCSGDIYTAEIPKNLTTTEALKEYVRQQTISETITIPLDTKKLGMLNTDKNAITVTVTAEDFAGNKKDQVISFDFDIAAPTVELEFNGTVVNDKYFAAQRTAKITVTDAYFYDLGVEFAVTEGVSISDWKTVGEYKYQKTITYSVEGDHTFDVTSIMDKGGNSGEVTDKAKLPGHYFEFILDYTNPVIREVKFYEKAENSAEVIKANFDDMIRENKNKTVYAKVYITEHNFADGIGNDGIIGVKDGIIANNKGEPYTEPTYRWLTAEEDTAVNEDMHVLYVEFPADAIYDFSFSYTDLSGRTLNPAFATKYFAVDKTKPTGTIEIDEFNPWSDFIDTISFGALAHNQNLNVTINANDVTSGIKTISYYISHEEVGIGDLESLNGVLWTTKTFNENALLQVEFPLPDSLTTNDDYIVYAKILDNAGNSYILNSEGIILDDSTSKPLITITPPHQESDYIYNGNVELKVKVTEPVMDVGKDSNALGYSGIDEVAYEVYCDNVRTDSGKLLKSNNERMPEFNKNILVIGNDNNSNNVKVVVTAVDKAGNQNQKEIPLMIDMKDPIVTIRHDDDGKRDTTSPYYNRDRYVYVDIQERNFDSSLVNWNLDGGSLIGWSEKGSGDSTVHTATIKYHPDGDYQLVVNEVKDKAGRSSGSQKKSDAFTVDQTTPKITVNYTNNDVKNGNYYKGKRTAEITITEHNFDAKDVQIQALENGANISATGFTDRGGDKHYATVTFDADAICSFDIAYTDKAGNKAAEYNTDNFVVDLTPPTVEITGVVDKSANKDTVSPAIRIDDTNYSANDVTITLVGAKKGNVDVSSMVSRINSETGQILSFANFGDDMDDVYTLTAKSMDKAGNETTQSITFSVNRHGSTYAINKDTKKMLDKGYTKEPVSVIIEETNVDTLEFIELSYSKDGKIVKLTEGKDYTVKAEGGQGQWKKYTYTILASCFAEEGKYNINITSVDRAQNESNNKVQSFDVEFVVDKTAPTLAVSNLEDNTRYDTDTHQFVINVKDNTKLSKVELYIDGKLYYTYKGEELTVEDGKVYINVENNGDEWQTIKLIAYDEADNPTDPLEYRILVTANGWIQFVNNKPAFYGTIGGLVAAAFIIFFIIWKRKKDQEEKAA